MTAAPKIADFPFDTLPRLAADEITLAKRLSRLYTLFEERRDVFADVVKPIKDLLGADVTAELVHMEALSLEDVVSALPERFVLGTIRMDPHTKRAFAVFDSAFAHALVSAALSGGKTPTPETLRAEELKPLSPMSEAVVEFVLVGALERISAALGNKTFSLAFENVVRDAKKLMGMYSNSDRFAVMSARFVFAGREFYVKLALPLTVADVMASETAGEEYLRSRLGGFESFRSDYELEIGRVELMPADLEVLAPGDIVLLDESRVSLARDRRIAGEGVIRPVGTSDPVGFVAELTHDGDQILAKVRSVL